MNLFWSFWKKTLLLSMVFEILFAWILVKLFGSHNEYESILGDVLLVILFLWGIQLFISIKNLIFWYLNFKLNQNELINSEVKFLIENKFPKPNPSFDYDNPEFYYQDVTQNESLSTELRILGSQKYLNFLKNESFGSLIRNNVMNNSYKESIKRYGHYCEKNNIN